MQPPPSLNAARGAALARILLTTLLLAGCANQPPGPSPENAANRKKASEEIRRICALPQPERDAEIQPIQRESGVTLYCGERPESAFHN